VKDGFPPVEEQLEILTRGVVDLTTKAELERKLERSRAAGTPLTVKVGFDPTAPDIHLGHTVVLRKMRQFEDLGHRVVFVIGDFTGMIGDPTGRNKTRPPLSKDEIQANAETYKRQCYKVLDPEATEIRFNSEWLSPLGAEGLIRLAAQYNVARMLERKDFKERFQKGIQISLHEFLYPLAQAYDSVAVKADVELGGTDQLFNLNVGRDIMPAYGLEPQVVLTTPLLEGTDGVQKMSKSLGNYIGVTEPAEVMYAKLMSISDELMWRYYALLTDLLAAEIESAKAAGRPMASKMALGRRIVADFHGASAAEAAEAEWRRVHQQGQAPSELATVTLAPGPIKPHVLVVTAGLAKSNGEAVRLLRQRAVRRDGETLDASADVEVAKGASFVLSVGAARHVRIVGE
jgi:tyrosyl-tRNA synthetase